MVFKIATGEINGKCCAFVGVNHLTAAMIPRTGESDLVGGAALLRRLGDPPERASVCPCRLPTQNREEAGVLPELKGQAGPRCC